MTLDLRQTGWVDAGDGTGYLMTRSYSGELLLEYFYNQHLTKTNLTHRAGALGENEEGFGIALNGSQTAGLTNYMDVKGSFSGRVFAVAFNRRVQSRFSVIIDGFCYGVDPNNTRFDNNVALNIDSGKHFSLITDSLDDNEHEYIILVPNDATATVASEFQGIYTERKGRRAPTPIGNMINIGVLSTGYTTLSTSSAGRAPIGVSRVFLTNVHATLDRLCSIKSTITNTDIWRGRVQSITLAPGTGKTEVIEFSPAISFEYLQLKCDDDGVSVSAAVEGVF